MGVGVGDGGAGVDVGEGVGATVGDDGVSVDSDDGELLSFPHAIRAKAWLTNKADNNSQDSNAGDTESPVRALELSIQPW